MRLALVASVLVCMAAEAGVVQLKDGTRVEGDIRPADKGWEVVTATGKRFVAEDQVVSIQTSTTGPAEPAQAQGRVESLRRAVEAMDDIDQIVGRYEALLAQVTDAKAVEEIKAEIQKWRDLQARGVQRVGKRWLDAQGVAQLNETNAQRIAEVKTHIAQEQLREAAALVMQVLEADPDHLGALYLDALVSYRQQRLPQARRDLDRLAEAMPNHAPSVHNLAILQWRQRSQMLALTNFSKVLAAMPLDPRIHDNVLEVINAMTPEQRQSAAGARLIAQIEADEARLQEKMAGEGLERWGSTWVPKTQMDKMRQQQAEGEKKIEAMSAEYDKMEEDLEDIDQRIAANEDTIDSIEAQSYGRDDEGRAVRLRTPNRAMELRRQNDQLKQRRDRLVRDMQALQREAQQVRHQAPAPPFDGRLEMLDEQYAPEYARVAAAAR